MDFINTYRQYIENWNPNYMNQLLNTPSDYLENHPFKDNACCNGCQQLKYCNIFQYGKWCESCIQKSYEEKLNPSQPQIKSAAKMK